MDNKHRRIADILSANGIAVDAEQSNRIYTERETFSDPTPRAKKLRGIYYDTLSTADTEFPYWYTRRWNELEGEVDVVRRAEALKSAFSHSTPNILPDEKLVMQKTAYYRGSFPMPWLSNSFFIAQQENWTKEMEQGTGNSADELSKFGTGGGNVTKSFGNVISIAGKFGMAKEELPALMRLANEWKGKSVEDVSIKYEKMLPDHQVKEEIMRSVICMFDSGYTLPQGREVINYYYPLQYGLEGIRQIAIDAKAEVAGDAGGDGITGMDRLYFYEAVRLVVEGIQRWIKNYAKAAREWAAIEKDEASKQNYLDVAERLEWIAMHQPRDFREALQLTYTMHIASVNEDAISGMAIGRLGQVLFPWYQQDIKEGSLTKEEALEWMELYRIKVTAIDCFASAGVVGGVLSGNTFNNLTLGGLTSDGQSAANELEEIILEAGMSCQTPQPTLSVLYDEKLPESFLLKAVACDKTGAGYPAWMNNRGAIEFIMDQYGDEGMHLKEARAVAIGGCLETSPSCFKTLILDGVGYEIPGGAGQPTSVGVHFIANPKILELTLYNGFDHRTGQQVFPPHNQKLDTYQNLEETFYDYYRKAVDVLTKANNIQHDIWRKSNMSVINAFMKPDCLDTGRHIGNMGYRYNATFNVESCGTTNMVNSLVALKHLVYDQKKYSLEELKAAMQANFGYNQAEETGSYSMKDQVKNEAAIQYEDIYADCLKAPKYGNDNPYADQVLADYEEWFCEMCRDYESLYALPMYACQISVSTHGPQGSATLATPDGRLSGTTYADGSVSAYPGTDKHGAYALFNSATVWDHSMSQNSQMNLKIHPSAIKGQEGTKRLLELTRSYLRKGGFHIQYNIVDSKMLQHAQEHPEEYRDLMVRVAGFTQYWCEIGKPIQDEVIARTEYESC